MEKKYKGVFSVLLTPFHKDGSFDLDAARFNIKRLADSGIKGVLILGGTGEYQSITNEEHKFYTSQIVPFAKQNGMTVVLGVSRERPDEVIELIENAEQYGADLAMVSPPFYCNPTQREIIENFRYITENTKMDVLVYNNPFATGVAVDRETTRALMKMPHIKAVKNTTGNMQRLAEDAYDCPDDKSLFCGSEDLTFEAYVMGVDGMLSGFSGCSPKCCLRIYDAVQAGNYEAAKKQYGYLLPLLTHLENHPNCTAALKYLSKKYCGQDMGYMRRPRMELTAEEEQAIDALYAEYGYASLD